MLPDDDAIDPDSDAAAFREAIGPVRRLPETAEPPRPPRRRAAAAMRTADEAAALRESRQADPMRDEAAIGEAFAYRRDDVPADVLRRLQRADFAIEDEIDLHALRERAAEDLLRAFLARARDAGSRCVRIVHGKGLHSARGPILKGMVERVLSLRADVLACATAPAAQGGSGAMLVLLAGERSRRPYAIPSPGTSKDR